MLIGFHVEGWDHLVLRSYLAKLLRVDENLIEPDWIDKTGRGWEFVRSVLPKALRRFYGKCARGAIVGIDNDGNVDLAGMGLPEDPRHPRHWLHAEVLDACRRCRIGELVRDTLPQQNWLPGKQGTNWPVLVAVPVETIEAWLLITRAIVEPGRGSRSAEREPRHSLKSRFYGRPEASREDVERLALPLIRRMIAQHVEELRALSHSFEDFAEQVERHREAILNEAECW